MAPHVAWRVTLLLLTWCCVLPPPPGARASDVMRGTVYVRGASVNLTGPATSTARAASPAQCAWRCEADAACNVAEYWGEQGKCVTSSEMASVVTGPQYVAQPPNPLAPESYPSEMATPPDVGDRRLLIRQGARTSDPANAPPRSCAELLSRDVAAASGVYVIWPDNMTESRVWCDMDTDGGGWTMVYSYTTLYEALVNNANAVTPFPTWPLAYPEADLTPRSTTPPSDAHEFGALDFSLWQHVGEEFLIKSNVNNWIACEADTGSLARYVDGTVTCRMVDGTVTSPTCTSLPAGPWRVFLYSTGPVVTTDAGWSYAFIGSTVENWPVHDPCALTEANHVTGIWPRGQVWLR